MTTVHYARSWPVGGLRGMARSAEVDACIDKAGFLGRWFAEQPDALTVLALWGLRP